MDDDRLKPYLDAVKAARVARYAVARMAEFDQSLHEDLLRANEKYQQAYKELAFITDAFIET
jgi:hypothetical protein